ncbi:ABC transporter permease [Candidatus Aerophobetes bacterium]|nr:ABC transporter permease [Candidatus Aerophobetes bacterium]
MVEKKSKDKKYVSVFFEKYNIVVIFLLLCAFLSVLSPRFRTFSNFINILRQSSIYAMLGFGMTFVMLTGMIDLSVGSVVALSSCITGLCLVSDFGIFPSILMGILTGFGCGLINGVLITKWRVPFFIATVGVMFSARGTALVITNGNPVSGLPRAFFTLGGGYIGPVPNPVVIAACVFVIFYIVLTQTKFGRYTYCIGSNQVAARFSGINVDKYLTLIFGINGFAAGLVGVVLSSRLRIGSPIIASGYELDAIAAVAIGGTSLLGGEGSIVGTVIGALVLTVIRNGLTILGVSTFFQQVIMGIIIVVVVAIDMWRRGE